ncbi:MAG: undecaprenyl-diphosphate phosphatase [Deltaproteobacteria bacterium]|nr:undecaprenyl-diphosphate phosphatase [Deltaproteobacteria bacterium]
MEIIEAAALGAIQGLTEFLPVSSSGHLVLGQKLLGLDLGEFATAFDVAVHLGTLVAVFVVYRMDLADIIAGFFRGIGIARSDRSLSGFFRDKGAMYASLLVLGTLPAAVVGLVFKNKIEDLFSNPVSAGFGLIFTSLVLGSTLFVRKSKNKTPGPVTSFVIGIAQSVAIIPGISRSGSTIATGLLLGVKRNEAARFSFLLSVPAILGAVVLEGRHIVGSLPLGPLLAGFVVSTVVGYIALRALLVVVDRGRIYLFAPYCGLLGIIALVAFWR